MLALGALSLPGAGSALGYHPLVGHQTVAESNTIEVVYAVPAGGASRQLQLEILPRAKATIQDWMADQLDGRSFRFGPAVHFWQLPVDAATMLSLPGGIVQYRVADWLPGTAFYNPVSKYLIFYEGQLREACGRATWRPIGPVAMVSLAPTSSSGGNCGDIGNGSAIGTTLGVAVHEVLHALGQASECDPQFSDGGHVSDPLDIMNPGAAARGGRLDPDRTGYLKPGCGWELIEPWLAQTHFLLSIALAGDGGVEIEVVTGDGETISCYQPCDEWYRSGTTLRLRAAAGDGLAFAGYSGDCAGKGVCTLTMNGSKKVSAAFQKAAPPMARLMVKVKGKGKVLVSGQRSCANSCAYVRPAGTRLTLTALAAKGWRFTGWNNGCANRARCAQTVRSKTITANFKKR